MSAVQEKEKRGRGERKARESSVGGKYKPEEAGDRRPIIVQEKAKATAANGKEKRRSHVERGRGDRGREKESSERSRKTSKEQQDVGQSKARRIQSVESRVGKEEQKQIDAMYVKDLLEKRRVRKEGERSVREKGSREGQMSRRREEEGGKAKSRRDRTRTRTLSPTEIKQLLPSKAAYEMAGGDAREEAERGEKRERESGREAKEVTADRGTDEEYEDDFEDYDSNFEEDSGKSEFEVSSAAEEVEIQSHSPETEPWKETIRKQELEAIKKSIEKENNKLLEKKGVRKKPEVDSEKEEVGRLGRDRPGQVVDFSKASKRLRRTKKEAARRKRGEELLDMITLDAISYSILEIPAVPYEEFMNVFGKSNTKQAHVQTNEDDLEEEVQTEEVTVLNKWTQNPPEYLGKASSVLTKEERLGVGGDAPSEEETRIHPNTNALRGFLSWASQVILTALEKKSGNFLSLENLPNHSKAMAFGDGFVSLNVSDVPFLKGRSVTHLCVLPKSSGRLLSVHVNKEKSFQKSMICIWSFRQLSKPLRILMASNRVSCCCFGLNQSNLVFAGFSDGSLCLWDLRESSAYHSRMTNSPEWSLQSPTYTTAASLQSGHNSTVVAVRLLAKADAPSAFGDFTPIQICSLDNSGVIIIWTVIQLEKTQRNAPSEDLGLAHWGRVKLVKRSTFSVFASLRDEIPALYITSSDILINEAEDDGFYVANSLGSVHHCSAYGSSMKPKFYVPAKQNAIVEATCLEFCPFNGNYFLVGCGDGTIRLHSRHQETPLICLNSNASGEEPDAQVVSLSWMHTRPCVFFALDALSRINIWDLGVSDMYPEISLLLTEKKITCMRLLPISDPRQVPFVAIGTEGGSVEIHKLKKEYGCRSANDVQNEMKMFLKYVSIL